VDFLTSFICALVDDIIYLYISLLNLFQPFPSVPFLIGVLFLLLSFSHSPDLLSSDYFSSISHFSICFPLSGSCLRCAPLLSLPLPSHTLPCLPSHRPRLRSYHNTFNCWHPRSRLERVRDRHHRATQKMRLCQLLVSPSFCGCTHR
jgi:hypothetical protein